MSDTYYVISLSSDGAYLDVVSQAELEARLADPAYYGHYGERDFLKPTDSIDLMARSGLIIIRGTAITPRPKEVVKTWDISS